MAFFGLDKFFRPGENPQDMSTWDWTPVAGETPQEIGYNYGQEVASNLKVAHLPESERLHLAIEQAEQWSDDIAEQQQYLSGLRRALGL